MNVLEILVLTAQLLLVLQSTIANRQSPIDKSTIQSLQSAIGNRPEPWYEKVLRRINPADFDYGAWLEERRRVLLDATATNAYFWYSFGVSVILVVTMLVYAKHRSDFHKFTWMSAGWLADFYNEVQHARDHSDAAIERYNRHIAHCNRAIEAESDGTWKSQQINEEITEWKQKYEELARLLDESTAERKKLAITLSERERTIADLSVRIEDLDQRIKGKPFTISGQPLTVNESNKVMVNRINMLERQLREEQSKNRAPKGHA